MTRKGQNREPNVVWNDGNAGRRTQLGYGFRSLPTSATV
jgi:hypothetical protein